MKFSLAFLAFVAALASAAPSSIEEISPRSSINGIHQGTPFCDGRDHCVYLGRHAFTYLIDPKSINANKGVVCESYDNNGHGRGACQFPNKISTTIECDYTGDIAYVKFGCHKSSLKFQQRTKMTAIWSSQKSQGLAPQTCDSETTEVGDDLYIRCHAGRHHHEDQSNKDYNNNNNNNNNNGGSGYQTYDQGSAGGYVGGSAGGSIGGSVGGSISGSGSIEKDWNAGLPNYGH